MAIKMISPTPAIGTAHRMLYQCLPIRIRGSQASRGGIQSSGMRSKGAFVSFARSGSRVGTLSDAIVMDCLRSRALALGQFVPDEWRCGNEIAVEPCWKCH